MKAVSILLAVVLVCVNAVEDQDVLQQWNKFQADFGKSYRSPVEARKRLAIFQDNLNRIDSHNKLFENGESTYALGINQFADWTKDEFRSYVNRGLVNRTETLKSSKAFVKTPNFVAPDSVDWREKNAVTPVKNQGGCGSCWSFSATGAIEGQLGIQKTLVSLSEQELIDCSKGLGNMGCNGGALAYAFEYVLENGISSEEDYGYEEIDYALCRSSEYKRVTKLSDYFSIRSGSESSLTEALAQIGPVSVAVDASDDFELYSHGIFDGSCSSTKLNHGVLAVGYGTENGKDFYIIKNSWDTTWGEDGYIRLARNSRNKCGVATQAFFPEL